MATHYIIKDESIMRGAPVIQGTRIPVERLKALIDHGYTEESIKKEFPGLSISKIRGVLSELLEVGLEKIGK